MRTIVLNANKMLEEADTHQYLQWMMGLPDYYGRNLDALYDCLTDLDQTKLEIIHAQEGNDWFFRVLQLMRDAERSNEGLQVHVLIFTEKDKILGPDLTQDAMGGF